ncbi:MAG: flippase [Erythrobacter sp.]
MPRFFSLDQRDIQSMGVQRNSIYNIVGQVLPLGLSLVTLPLYLDAIGLERFGVVAIGWLLLGYFGMFDLGLGRAVTHRIAELQDAEADARLEAFHTALAANLVIGVAVGALLWAFAELFFSYALKIDKSLLPELEWAGLLLGLMVPVASLTGVMTGALQGRELFKLVNIVSVLSTFLFQIFPLGIAWLVTTNTSAVLGAGIAARIIAFLALWVLCAKEFESTMRVRFDRGQMALLLKFGGWVFLTALIAPLLTIADRFAIGAVLGASAVTYFTVPLQIIQRLAIVPTAISSALFPRLSATKGSREFTRLGSQALATTIPLMTLAVVPVLLISELGIELWLGANFAQASATVAKILLVGIWFNALALIPFTMIQASGRPQTVSMILLCEVPFYLAILYFGLSQFGLIGCAIAFLIRSAADFFLLTAFAGREVLPIRETLIGGVLLVAGAAIALLVPSGSVLYWVISGFFVSLVVSNAVISLPAGWRARALKSINGTRSNI